MKVVLVLEIWGTGGIEAYVDRVGRELAQSSVELCVWVLRPVEGGALPALSWATEVKLISPSRWKSFLKLREELVLAQADIVHLHLNTSMLPALLAVRGLKSVRSVGTWHLPLHIWPFARKMSQKLACRLVDVAVGASEVTARDLREHREDAWAISPPIEMVKISNKGCADEGFRIVGSGRLADQKDWPTLLKALKVLVDGGVSGVSCRLLGEGENKEELEQMVDAYGLRDEVTFVGHLAYADAMQEIVEASLFVLPSLYEGFGMAAVEAMTLGVPTVTSNYAASDEYILDGETGNHFPVGDAEALAELIRWHKENPEKSSAIGAAGKAYVEARYAPKEVAKSHEKLYQTLLENSND